MKEGGFGGKEKLKLRRGLDFIGLHVSSDSHLAQLYA